MNTDAGGRTGGQKGSQIGKHTERQSDRYTDRETASHTHGHNYYSVSQKSQKATARLPLREGRLVYPPSSFK